MKTKTNLIALHKFVTLVAIKNSVLFNAFVFIFELLYIDYFKFMPHFVFYVYKLFSFFRIFVSSFSAYRLLSHAGRTRF